MQDIELMLRASLMESAEKKNWIWDSNKLWDLWVVCMQVNTVWLPKVTNLHRLELKVFYLTLKMSLSKGT